MTIHPTAKVDETVRVYGRSDLLHVGAHSRIDAYCVLTVGEQGVFIADHVHVGAHVCIFGSHGKVSIGRYCSISPGAMLFTATDEMSWPGLIGACAPAGRRVPLTEGDMVMKDMAAVGAGAVVLPPARLGRGSVVGALSFVCNEVQPWNVVICTGQVLSIRTPVELP